MVDFEIIEKINYLGNDKSYLKRHIQKMVVFKVTPKRKPFVTKIKRLL